MQLLRSAGMTTSRSRLRPPRRGRPRGFTGYRCARPRNTGPSIGSHSWRDLLDEPAQGPGGRGLRTPDSCCGGATSNSAALAARSGSLSASCDNGQSVAANDSADAKHLTDTLTVGVKASELTLSSWAKNKISAEANASGLCETKISVENVDNQGFDVVVDYKNPILGDGTPPRCARRPRQPGLPPTTTRHHLATSEPGEERIKR